MVQKISKYEFLGNGPIKMLYPGKGIGKGDTGIGSIGRIDHPAFRGKTVIPMHPHSNDEILSYFRTGKAEHKDSEGMEKTIGGKTLMLMKAGKVVFHEEKINGQEELFEGLQIFIRPKKKDLVPEVKFLTLPELHSENEWRLIASPSDESTFQFSSSTWIYDTRLVKGNNIQLPTFENHLTILIYTFQGEVNINKELNLKKMDSLLVRNETVSIESIEDSELVLFVTDEGAEVFKEGMYSGNKF